jgi:hypothetical protein
MTQSSEAMGGGIFDDMTSASWFKPALMFVFGAAIIILLLLFVPTMACSFCSVNKKILNNKSGMQRGARSDNTPGIRGTENAGNGGTIDHSSDYSPHLPCGGADPVISIDKNGAAYATCPSQPACNGPWTPAATAEAEALVAAGGLHFPAQAAGLDRLKRAAAGRLTEGDLYRMVSPAMMNEAGGDTSSYAGYTGGAMSEAQVGAGYSKLQDDASAQQYLTKAEYGAAQAS